MLLTRIVALIFPVVYVSIISYIALICNKIVLLDGLRFLSAETRYNHKHMALSEKQKQHILTGLIALSILPIPVIVKLGPDTFSTWASAELYISSILGYFGIVMLMWMYILGNKSVIGLYFSDQAMIRKIHGRFGKYGTLFIFAHPIASSLSHGYSWLTFTFIPNISSSFETYVTFGRIAFIALVIIWVTSALVRSKIAYRPWKYIHYLAYAALPLALLHIPFIGSSFAIERPAQLYYFAIVGLFVLFSVLRIRQLFGIGKVSYRVTGNTTTTADVMLLHLLPSSTRRLTSNKGQFIYLQPNLLGEEHPFSVLHHNEKTGELYVAYKKFGRFTKRLASLQKDDIVYVDGPYGTFTEQIAAWPDAPTVFVAGGIGITPFVDHVLAARDNQWLFYANQTEIATAFGPTLADRLGERYVPILSNEKRDDREQGFMRPELFTKYLTRPTDYRYFICGPPKMMEVTKTALLGLGVPAEKIFSEDFSF